MLEHDKDLMACPYTLKTLDFDKMRRRLKNEKIDKPDDLMKAGFTFPIKVPDPETVIVEKGIMKATHAPTGCMLIKRHVIEKLIKSKVKCHIFPIDEFWSDMGTHEELELLRKSGKV